MAIFAFMGMSFLGGFIGGEEVRRRQTPEARPPATVVFLVHSQREIQNLSENLRIILERVADKTISAEDAVVQIYAELRLSNIGSVAGIREIVQGVVTLATDDAIQDAVETLVKIAQSVSKPSPSPIPTATILFPSK